MSEQSQAAECQSNSALIVLTRFGRHSEAVESSSLRRRSFLDALGWIREPLRREHGLRPCDTQWEALLAVLALWVVARRRGVPESASMRPTDHAFEACTTVWAARDCGAEVNAGQVAAAYLAGVWAPPDTERVEEPWEAARVVIMELIGACVGSGLLNLAKCSVSPLDELCRNKGTQFHELVARGKHAVAGQLMCAGPDTFRRRMEDWDCGRSLWELVWNVVLGPGPHGQRPQAAEYATTPFGRWLNGEVGITVGNVVRYVQVDNEPGRGCPSDHGDGRVMTWSCHRYVTPAKALSNGSRNRGHELVKLWPCKNEDCVSRLRHAFRELGECNSYAQPLSESNRCEYCGQRCGQRPMSVWRPVQ